MIDPRASAATRRFYGWLVIALLVAAGLAFPAGAWAQADATARQFAILRINIVDLLANEPRLPLPIRQRYDALRSYYDHDNGDLLWLGTRHAAAFVARLRDAESDGLLSRDYPSGQLAALIDAAPAADLRGLGLIELYFSAVFLDYASDLRVGRFLPNKVDPNFFLPGRSIDELAALTGLRDVGDLDVFFAAWQPSAPQYASLRELLYEYRSLAGHGGWPPIPLGDTLRLGMSDPRVPALRARLALTDGAYETAFPGAELVYADDLVAVVERFQARHGLDVDGLIGPATIVALNVPVDERIDNIVVAMERWRWMPEDLGSQYILVNIAGFELRRVRAGAVEERMAVVVGKPYHRTPVFSDTIRYLEFNPYWNVPTSIALNEELPSLRANPGSVAASGFEAVRGDQVIDVRTVDWNQYGAGNFPFQLRQRPGANNALGRVKFMFPNDHNVYLHDTPARSLFSRSERAFSHGCIRLARPLDLAEQVLAVGGVQGWNRTRIETVVASAERTIVNLEQPLRVHITYLTAWTDNGTPNFRKDIYGHDEKLLAALDGRALAW